MTFVKDSRAEPNSKREPQKKSLVGKGLIGISHRLDGRANYKKATLFIKKVNLDGGQVLDGEVEGF